MEHEREFRLQVIDSEGTIVDQIYIFARDYTESKKTGEIWCDEIRRSRRDLIVEGA